ncbi:MAG: hypothetical protein R3B48_20185 [Kofleriaceae bacterium]
MRTVLVTALSLFVVFGGSCEGGTEVGNPVISIGLSAYDLASSTVAPGGQALAGGNVEVDAAWIALKDLRLRPAQLCEDIAEVEVSGPLAVNLLGPIPDALRGFPVEPGGYCRVEFRWHKAAALPGAPTELDAVAVYVSGTRRDGVRFVIRSERNDALELRARGGAFTIEPTLAGLFVGFDMQLWLAGVDLDGAVVGNDGVIHVEKGQNDAQLSVFEANVASASKLFKDLNGDGQLGSDEHDDADVIGDGASR